MSKLDQKLLWPKFAVKRLRGLKVIDDNFIQQITARIVERFNPRRVVLFGSRARGDAELDSDIDLFIEMESDKRPPERSIEISRLFGLRDWGMDVIVYTPGEVSRLRGIHGTLLSIIESEGKILYERQRN